MYFYLLKHDYIPYVETNISNEKEKNIKILVYGCLCYILTHFLFVNLINTLSTYFWLILCLDIGTIYLLYTQEKNNKIEINDDFRIKNYDSEVEVDDIIDNMVGTF
jgi:hypothetical protein